MLSLLTANSWFSCLCFPRNMFKMSHEVQYWTYNKTCDRSECNGLHMESQYLGGGGRRTRISVILGYVTNLRQPSPASEQQSNHAGEMPPLWHAGKASMCHYVDLNLGSWVGVVISLFLFETWSHCEFRLAWKSYLKRVFQKGLYLVATFSNTL